MSIESVSIRQEGDRVLLIQNGRLVLDLPWQAALDVGRGICAKARLSEEHAKADSVITDQAILIRAGFPLGLTRQPHMIREAIKTANNDRKLRRYIPNGIRSQAVVGNPTLIQKGPAHDRG